MKQYLYSDIENIKTQEELDKFVDANYPDMDIFDWCGVIRCCNFMTEEFIEKYISHFDGYFVAHFQKPSESIIEKVLLYGLRAKEFRYMFGWFCVFGHIKENFVRKFMHEDIDWDLVFSYVNLSEGFYEEFPHLLDATYTLHKRSGWEIICKNRYLSESFLEKNCDKIHWKNVCIYQRLSEDFIKKFWYKMIPRFISKYQRLSESFIKENLNVLYLGYIFLFQEMEDPLFKVVYESTNLEELREQLQFDNSDFFPTYGQAAYQRAMLRYLKF